MVADQNNFGQKLMEKMGWTDGKGLGANEDGRQEPIKVSKKDGSRGKLLLIDIHKGCMEVCLFVF